MSIIRRKNKYLSEVCHENAISLMISKGTFATKNGRATHNVYIANDKAEPLSANRTLVLLIELIRPNQSLSACKNSLIY